MDARIDENNNTDDVDDKWIMCSPYKGRFHMYGDTGAYNIKFISSNNTYNLYEAVYDKDGNLITENDDYGKNMGTYNYASSSKDPDNHKKFDVKTYEDWGNTQLDPAPVKKSWNKNVVESFLDAYCEPRAKGTLELLKIVDEKAKLRYIDVCEQIGINYYLLLLLDFSDACY